MLKNIIQMKQLISIKIKKRKIRKVKENQEIHYYQV